MSLKTENVMGIQPPDEEGPEYMEAEEIAPMARDIIQEHHEHLRGAPIYYAFKRKASKYAGMAQARSEKERLIGGYDFVITIAKDVWDCLSEEKRIALLDHELEHCVYHPDRHGEMKPKVLKHDVEEFVSIIDRRGLWSNNLNHMAIAMRRTTIPEGEEE